VRERRERRRKHLLDDPKEKIRYWKLKEAALDRTLEQATDPSQGRQREEEKEKEEENDDDVSVILTEVLAICLGPSLGMLGASLNDILKMAEKFHLLTWSLQRTWVSYIICYLP
jgi:hypothetical protein